MKLVTCSAAIANTRDDGSGSRRLRIWKGTTKERLVTIDRHGMKFADPLPPELAADPELVIREVPSDKPQRMAIDQRATADVAALDYNELVSLGNDLKIKTSGVKKEVLRANVAAALAAREKAGEGGEAQKPTGKAGNGGEAQKPTGGEGDQDL